MLVSRKDGTALRKTTLHLADLIFCDPTLDEEKEADNTLTEIAKTINLRLELPIGNVLPLPPPQVTVGLSFLFIQIRGRLQ